MNIKLRGHYWRRGSSWIVEIPCLDLISISGSLPEGFTSLTNRINNLAHPKELEISIEVGDGGIFLISSSDKQGLIEIFDKCLLIREGLK